jgi:glycosyltransferase involved in cell wall biosynthesis
MSEILLDVTRLCGRFLKQRIPTGVDRVSQAYVQHFGNRSRAVVRIGSYNMVLSRAGSKKLFDSLLNNTINVSRLIDRLHYRDCFCALWGHNLAGSFLFNMGHSGLDQNTYQARLKKFGLKPLILVHDLIPLSHPEFCRPGEMDRHLSRMNNVLRFASGVITNSQITLDDLGGFAQKTAQPIPPSVAAPLAAAQLPAPSSNRPFLHPYFIVLGTIEPRKNHLLLLHIWRKLIASLGEKAPHLLIIGQRGWECENVIDLLERCESLRGYVKELSTCSDADLATYLFHSQALLFPSFVEGYGMPLMEALTIGVPVIASDLPVFREIAGSIPDYLDPLDSIGWMKRIEAYAQPTHPDRTAQATRRSIFEPPTWSRHFQLVEELMERIS